MSRSIVAPGAEAVLPASSVTSRTEVIVPSARVLRSATPAEANTVTCPPRTSVKVTVALTASASMPATLKATALCSSALITPSAIVSASASPRSALVSRSITAPAAEAVLPASSVTSSTEVIGPSARPLRSAVKSPLAATSTRTVSVPSEKMTTPLASASRPDTVKATAPCSAALITLSAIVSVSASPRSALVSRSITAPSTAARFPAISVATSSERISPSRRLLRSAKNGPLPSTGTETRSTPSVKVTTAVVPASSPPTVKATASLPASLIVVTATSSVRSGSYISSSSKLKGPDTAVLPASSV